MSWGGVRRSRKSGVKKRIEVESKETSIECGDVGKKTRSKRGRHSKRIRRERTVTYRWRETSSALHKGKASRKFGRRKSGWGGGKNGLGGYKAHAVSFCDG